MRQSRLLLILPMIGSVVAPTIIGQEASIVPAAIAEHPVVAERPLVAERPVFTQVGFATWYGERFVGHDTASGERLARHGLTAAHRTLPFGTIVRVTNLENGRVVKVRVNDRGPNLPRKARRIIDLSDDAAAALGITTRGVAKIRIEAVASDQRLLGDRVTASRGVRGFAADPGA